MGFLLSFEKCPWDGSFTVVKKATRTYSERAGASSIAAAFPQRRSAVVNTIRWADTFECAFWDRRPDPLEGESKVKTGVQSWFVSFTDASVFFSPETWRRRQSGI